MKHLKKYSLIMIAIITLMSSCYSPINITSEEARELAKDAFLFGFPPVLVEKQFYVNSYVTAPEGLKAPVNQFAHGRRFVDASNRQYVGFNVDILNTFASIDLSGEPLVITAPEMGERFWLLQLINTWNEVPAVPSSRTHGGQARTFLVAGPQWKGDVPEGMELLRADTELTLIVLRLYCKGKEEYAEVNALQDQYTITPLSQWGKDYKAPKRVPLPQNVDGTKDLKTLMFTISAEDFFSDLNRLLVKNPAYERDAPMMKRIAKLGIVPGAEFTFSNYSEEIAQAIKEGFEDGKKAMLAKLQNLGKPHNNWVLAYDVADFGIDYTNRAAWTLIGVGGNLIEDAFYPTTILDSDNEQLDGSIANYKLTFTAEEIPPVEAFWSVTMYDTDSYLVHNEIDRYTLGDRSDLKYNKDGSLTIYMQKDRPSNDKISNWLPAPNGTFRLALRLYTPKKNVINGTWIPPFIQKAD